MYNDSLKTISEIVNNIVNIDWISLLVAIAALITAIAALLTVREIRKQRESSYHPELHPSITDFHIYGVKAKDIYLPYDYYNHRIDDRKKSLFNEQILMKLYNVGLAAAKNVVYKWADNTDDWIKAINEVNKEGFFNITKDEKGRLLVINIPKYEIKHNHLLENQFSKKYYGFILPSSADKAYSNLVIPKCYLDLYITYICIIADFYTKDKPKNPKRIGEVDFPSLYLNITYEDLLGKAHAKSYKIDIDFNIMTHPLSLSEQETYFGSHDLITTEIKSNKK